MDRPLDEWRRDLTQRLARVQQRYNHTSYLDGAYDALLAELAQLAAATFTDTDTGRA